MKKNFQFNFLSVIVVLAIVMIFPTLFNLIGEYFWFVSVGYSAIFLKIIGYKVSLFSAGLVLSFLFLFANYRIAQKFLKSKKQMSGTVPLSLLFISFLEGLYLSSRWEVILKYLNFTKFNVLDPVFSKDVSFYVFQLPFYNLILNTLIFLILISLGGLALIYGLNYLKRRREPDEDEEGWYDINWDKKNLKKAIDVKILPHLSVLSAALFVIFAMKFYLQRYEILFSNRGAVFGAGYTDIYVQLPLLLLLSAASIVISGIFIVNSKIKKQSLLLYGFGALIVLAVLGSAAGFVVQEYIVKPDEFNKEQIYLERNIENSLKAYGLDTVKEQEFSVGFDLSKEDITQDPATIENIRLWDWRPLLKTYNELQIFRTYYTFTDVDIDRYTVNGVYKQYMLSPREINVDNLPAQSRTWVNRHMVYTHGYGLAMSPVSKVSEEGLPEFIVQDIPPKANVDDPVLEIKNSAIYFGEQTDDYAIVGTKTQELDYPQGESNTYTTYTGKDGVQLTPLKRFIYMFRFGTLKLLVSGSITSESKILFHRNIDDRVSTVTPFLLLDNDPYMVISNGKLYWMYDTYTETNRYPYSEGVSLSALKRINYLRNSAKVVIDAYDGTTTFYIIDESDPIIQTYAKIFPSLFKDFESMPEDLKKHIRYPEDLFKIQSYIYSTYHMKDPRVFYNKEDLWRVPDEVYMGNTQKVEPYYIVTQLPDSTNPEFIMMLPFVPRGKENLIGWMAARSDVPNYGNLMVYLFSKQSLIYGPMQIESRINQDPEISEKISLWDQIGSSVIRGNLLVIPIQNSLLYVEPLFLQSTETGALPELKRVTVSYGNQIVMKETLGEALDEIFGGTAQVTVPVPEDSTAVVAEKTQGDLISEANTLYEEAQDALKEGDFTGYAEKIEKLGEVLKQVGK